MKNIFNKIKISELLLIYFCSSIVIAILSELPFLKNLLILDSNFWLLIVNLILLAWLIFKFTKEKINFNFLWRNFKCNINYKEIFFIVIINIMLSLGFVLLTFYIVYNINPELLQKLINEEKPNNTFSSIIFESLGGIIIGPFVEEFIFRGILLNRFKIRKSVNFSIITSSILFGLMHSKLSILGATFFGVFMCLLFLKYENILIPISAHILNNLIVSLISCTNSSSTNSNFTINQINMYGLVGCIFLLISSFFTFKYVMQNWPKNNIKDLEVT